MYPENTEGTQVIVGSMNMGYISDTARNQTHNLFCPKREPISLGHSDGQIMNKLLLHHQENDVASMATICAVAVDFLSSVVLEPDT